MTDTTPNHGKTVSGNAAPGMSPREFANWGADRLAYVRPSHEEGMDGFAVHLADGRKVGFAESYDQATAGILEHDLFPLSVH